MKSIFISIFAATGLIVTSNALASDMPPLAKKSNCTACHSLDKKVVGPAWMDVSRKYKDATKYIYNGKEYGLEEGLIMKVSKGGAGVWGTMPMPANVPAVSSTDIKELVQYILNLAK